jgi:Fe-S-cluster containining protein
MQCRAGCGACCIAPSISSPIPGMPSGKSAGTPCVHLDGNYLCALFESAERPEVCVRFQAGEELCGDTRTEALARLEWLERQTQ